MRKPAESIKPIQPYVALDTHDYQKIVKNQYGISHIYLFNASPETKRQLLAVPDGSVDLLFGLGPEGMHSFIGGTVFQAKPWELSEEDTYFGARFYPGACRLPSNLKIDDVVNADVEISAEKKIRQLGDLLISAEGLEDRADIFLNYYFKMTEGMGPSGSVHKLETYLRNRIYQTGGQISIKELSQETAYSAPYLRRIFNKVHGVSPKVFEKFVRFQNVLDYLTYGIDKDPMKLDQIAVRFGYYDQPHMIKEFKQYTGKTPEQYLKEISGTQIKNLSHD